MSNWMKQIHNDIRDQIEKYERGKYTFSEDEINVIMPKVVEFYNEHPKDQDVYRDASGVILLIQTPKMITNKEGDIINTPRKFPSQYEGGETSFLLSNCKFRLYGKTGTIGIFASMENMKKIEGIYDKKAFIKASKLQLKYKKLGSEDKPLNFASFIAKHELEDLDELDESEYITYYSANITQVID